MKMAEVSKVFTNAGMQEVSSVLVTGNILFSSDKNRSELKVILEKALSEYFNYEAFLFLKLKKKLLIFLIKIRLQNRKICTFTFLLE